MIVEVTKSMDKKKLLGELDDEHRIIHTIRILHFHYCFNHSGIGV